MSLPGNFGAGNVTRVIAAKLPFACMPPRCSNRAADDLAATQAHLLWSFLIATKVSPVRRFHLRC
jgi:hypothetical protein